MYNYLPSSRTMLNRRHFSKIQLICLFFLMTISLHVITCTNPVHTDNEGPNNWMKIPTSHLFLWWQWQSSPLPCRGQTSSQPTRHSCHRYQPRRVGAGSQRWVFSGPPRTTPGSALWSVGPRLLVGLRARLWTLLRCRGTAMRWQSYNVVLH